MCWCSTGSSWFRSRFVAHSAHWALPTCRDRTDTLLRAAQTSIVGSIL
jgi:hypothetical protein